MASASNKTNKSTNFYRISEVSRLSGVPSQTIHFYIREGLLPPPVKTSKTMAYYTDAHLDRLYFIKKHQIESKERLKEIKHRLESRAFNRDSALATEDRPAPYAPQKETIIKTAIELFSRKGYAETSITDVVEAAGIGRGTYYQLFNDKEALLLECADRVFFELYSHVWETIKNETDMVRRLRIRFEEYIKSYPKWRDMMDIIKSMAAGNNQKGSHKYQEILQQIIRPIARDVDRAVEQQLIRPINSTLAAYMLLGAGDYCARLHYEQGYGIADLLDHLMLLIFNGIRYRGHPE